MRTTDPSLVTKGSPVRVRASADRGAVQLPRQKKPLCRVFSSAGEAFVGRPIGSCYSTVGAQAPTSPGERDVQQPPVAVGVVRHEQTGAEVWLVENGVEDHGGRLVALEGVGGAPHVASSETHRDRRLAGPRSTRQHALGLPSITASPAQTAD
jgi:hypothetical protein